MTDVVDGRKLNKITKKFAKSGEQKRLECAGDVRFLKKFCKNPKKKRKKG